MKILFASPLYGRPEITRLFISKMEQTLPDYAELIPFFTISGEDKHFKQILSIIDGYYYAVSENFPLGRKKNAGMTEALKLEWDYVVEMGSDDLFTSLLWTLEQPYFEQKCPFFGIQNLYVYNVYTDEAKFVPDFHLDPLDEVSAIGPGRAIRRDIVENSMPMWPDSYQFGMDGQSSINIYHKSGERPAVIDNKRLPVVCDLKTDTCLTGWHEFDDRGDPVDAGWVRSNFGFDALMLKNLRDFDSFHNSVLHESRDTDNRMDAFDRVNQAYIQQTGEKRFASYESYRVAISKRFKK